MKLKRMTLVFILSILATVLVACVNSETRTEKEYQNGGSSDENENNGALEGSIVIDGSGTVYPLMSSIAEEDMLTEQENVSVEVSRAGTSAGYEKLIVEEDRTDVKDASGKIIEEKEE